MEQHNKGGSLPKPEGIEAKSVWNSLEISKLLVSLLTPIAIVWFTAQSDKNFRNSDHLQENEKRVFEYRQKVYDSVSYALNDFLCYELYIGNWKELSPAEIIGKKRK